MPFRIALKRVRIFLLTSSKTDYRVRSGEVVGKLAGSLDGDQRLRAVGWSLNLSRQQSSYYQDFTGGLLPSSKLDQNLLK